jgi:hypothetical protein
MVRQLKHEEIAELLGAYALDAVDPDEAQIVEAHLATCPRCRDEVRDHREVASLLAYSGAAAPPGLWDRLAAALEEPAPPVDAPNLAPVTPIGRPSPKRVRAGGPMLAAAAVVLVLLGLLGGLWLKVDNVTNKVDKVGYEQALSDAALKATTAPGARTIQLATPDNRVLADAVVLPDGQAYLWNVRLPALGSDRAYQLWAIVGADGQKRSVSVLGNAPRVRAFTVPTASVAALAITNEVASGAEAPTQQAVVYGILPA